MTARRVGLVLLIVLVAVAVDLGADRTARFYDLTAEDTASLTSASRQVVEQVDDDVDITVFLRRSEPGRVEAATLLDRYRRHNRRISYDVVDPDDSPGEVRRLGIDPVAGGVAIASRGRVERAPLATEQDITAGLARILRGRSALLCYATGHGEPDLSSTLPDGLSQAAELLRDNGYGLEEIDLLATSEVPAGCEALLLVNPTAPLGDAGRGLGEWLAAGGRALILTDPVSNVDLTSVVRPYGLGIERGIVIEQDPELAFPGDEASPIVRTYASASPVVRRLPPTFFPGVQEVVVDDAPDAEGLFAVRLADTSADSYLEREPLAPEFDPAADRRGPVTVGGAADLSRVEEGRIHRTRLVVWGDSDFATNGFLREAGNSTLLVQALDWVTLDEDLVTLSANLPEDRPLELTRARRRYALFISAGVVPGLFLLAGAMVWAVRRSR